MSNKQAKTAITPTLEEDFPEWYQQVIKAAALAENSPTRGCMTVKPYGWAIWELMQRIFDDQLKDYGVQNCSFPLMIPMSFLAKEAEHVEGFAKECAVITHHRLEAGGEMGLQPAESAKLEEPYVVRPTSETIIGDAMSRWIQSYRDLPMQLNQWASVLRWEMRTRMFLRTAEFFWHEGHNAFEDHEGAKQDCLTILDMYEAFFRDYCAFTGFKGVKTPEETFPGANKTYSMECMMMDGKAIQMCTSHDLGTNFAETFNITYQDRAGKEQFAHTTSWAFTTRVIGALIMMHADNDGMVMPPRIAPHQAIILPFLKGKDGDEAVMDYAETLRTQLKEAGIRVKLDSRDMRSGDKMWDAIKKGIPLRIEAGAREMEEGQVTLTRRDLGRESQVTIPADQLAAEVQKALDAMHEAMLAKSEAFHAESTHDGESLDDVVAFFKAGKTGFIRVPIAVLDDPKLQDVYKEYSLTARNMPFADEGQKVLIAKAY